MRIFFISLLVIFGGVMFGLTRDSGDKNNGTIRANQQPVIIRETVDDTLSRAVFSTGCFWCIEPIFESTEGVAASISGYAGGSEYNPTYEDVYSETTSHRESVMVFYNPSVVSYKQLADIFWQNIDPTDDGGQFFDRGFSYTTAIHYMNEDEKQIAETTKQELNDSGKFDKPIATELIPFSTFYEAEDYHQDFYKKSPGRYQNYSDASGRKEFKERIWQEIQREQKQD